MPFRSVLNRIPQAQVELLDPFWLKWQSVVAEVSLPLQWQKLVETKRIQNFSNAAAGTGEYVGLWFNDSDVYKWIEACAYSLHHYPSSALREKVDEAVSVIEAAQCEDGYLNTYFQLKYPELKWRNLNMMHEMYCAGHLIEAAVAMKQTLNDDRLLRVATRFADHILDVFGPGKRLGYCGHQELELALLRLADVTNEPRYRDFAFWQIEARGQRPSPFQPELTDPDAQKVQPFKTSIQHDGSGYSGEYYQDHAPIREHRSVVGHAVRAMYFYIAAAELAKDAQDEELEKALLECWDSLVKRRMYVTGGIGPSAHNEGFTRDYDLPNSSSYAETCASCGLVMWGQSLTEATGTSDFADVMELALYNGMLSGLSMDGREYFYANPLETNRDRKRSEWFDCACCPPNIARIIAKVETYAASQMTGGLAIHIPIAMRISLPEADVAIESRYPQDGKVRITVNPKAPGNFKLMIRIPDWADEVSAEIAGDAEPADFEDGYMVFDREWTASAPVDIEFEMDVKFLSSHPKVRSNLGRVAVRRGPIIYALESVGHRFDPAQFAVFTDGEISVQKSDVSFGLPSIQVEGVVTEDTFTDGLYASPDQLEETEEVATFIPYFAFGNRGESAMQVWHREA